MRPRFVRGEERLLLVEDDRGVSRTLADRLQSEGFAVEVADDLESGLRLAASAVFDLVVLDLMLPDGSGDQLLAALRRDGLSTPVLVLTARDAVADKVTLLRRGADDYLTKPFRAVELLARVEALLRRARGGGVPDERRVRLDGLVLDLTAGRASIRGAELALSEHELALLAYLVRHRGRPVPRGELLREVWRYDARSQSRTVDVHVAALRRKLGPERRLIRTVRGRGYLIDSRDHR